MQVSGGGLAVDAPSSGAPTSDAGSSTGERPISGLRGYSPGLDGLRAVGMAFMLGFHAEMPWSKGAFLALSLPRCARSLMLRKQTAGRSLIGSRG